jgi:nucleoside-diphosphate-sugar epimerase
MPVFVTGATGFIGSAIVQDLLRAGHSVLGLARSPAAADALKAAGATPHLGDLHDLDALRRGAELSDGVIHTAFVHDFSKFQQNCEIDRQAIGALTDALVGTDRPLIITSGTALVRSAPLAEEHMPAAGTSPRIASEQAAAAAAARGVHVSVVRLPPTVHGIGDHGFVPMLIALARQKGLAAYFGEGANCWPAVHRLDAATLFRLAFEKAAVNACYHGVAEQGVPFRDITAVIGRHLRVPVEALSAEQVADHFGWMAHFASIDNPASSAQTQQSLGWAPSQTELIADLEQGHYFTA